MVRDKVRIRFRKGGDLRLVSHHDLMRCFERMLRRADLPFHSTQGFNPKPRMAFALSLALGVVGCEEVVELELDGETDPNEVRRRLAAQAPAGLEILSAHRITPQTRAHVCRVCYRIEVPEDRREGLRRAAAGLLAQEHVWVERHKPKARRVDVRLYLRDLRLLEKELEIELEVTPVGTARPDELLHLLGCGDLLEGGAVLHRTTLELTDESAVPRPPAEAANTAGGPETANETWKGHA